MLVHYGDILLRTARKIKYGEYLIMHQFLNDGLSFKMYSVEDVYNNALK